MEFLLCVDFLVVAVLYWKTRKALLSITVASVIAQYIADGSIDYRFAIFYDVMGFANFVWNIWPYINIALVIATILGFIFRKFRSVLQD